MDTTRFTGIDVHKYFNLRQRVYLIDISQERDPGMFQSLSGTIVGRGRDSLSLQLPYSTGAVGSEEGTNGQIFKIVTESLGNGIQVAAALERIETCSTYHFRLRSNLEMYQRFRAPRVDVCIGLFQLQCTNTLDSCRAEFRRIARQVKSQDLPDGIRLLQADFNLGVGGIRVPMESGNSPSQLSLFVFDLGDGAVPVCALADLVWSFMVKGRRECGYRFIQISKSDQARISSYIGSQMKQRKIAAPLPKLNWELLDRMMCDTEFL